MFVVAKALTVLAALLAVASLHPRLRWMSRAAMACVAGVALCLAVAALL